MTALVKYEAARQALAEAHTFDEVKQLRNKAEAMRAYAFQAGDHEFAFWAGEIKLRAERKAGELLSAMEKNKGAASPTRSQAATTLKEIGITKSQSSRWQQEAELSEPEYKEWVTKVKKRGASFPTSSALRTLISKKANDAAKAAAKKIRLPDDKYDCIVIDPPWEVQKIEREVRPNQVDFDYPTMTEEELAAFGVETMASEDCHLFCWTTHKFMPMALRLLAAWGFKYVCTFVWHKRGGFQPIGLPQYNCEFALYARRGSPKFADTKDFFCCFEAPRREHSRKPDAFAIAAEPGLIAVVYLERTGLEKGGWKRVSDLVNRGSVHWYGAALNPATNRKCGCLRLGPDPIGRVRSIADKVDGPTLRRVLGDPIAMGYEKLGGEDPFK